MTYMDKDGTPKRPYMIHRALLGSIERFFATLVEHYAGNFPVWLAPVQVVVLPVSEKYIGYAREVYSKLFDEDLRVELDDSSERISYKIRAAEVRKIPYMIIVGAKEVEAGTVSVRRHGVGDLGQMTLSNFIKNLRNNIKNKK